MNLVLQEIILKLHINIQINSARELLEKAEKNAESYYLKDIQGNHLNDAYNCAIELLKGIFGESRKTESESFRFKAIQKNQSRAANNYEVEFCKGTFGESRKTELESYSKKSSSYCIKLCK
jgi:hypothetical protein